MDWSKIPGCLEGQDHVATLNCVPLVFNLLIRAGLIFAGVIAVIFIILSGIKMINSGGDPKQVEGARKTLTFAILGLVIILGSFFIIQTIAGITGAHCITKLGLTNCS